ncbi:N-acetylneuraminate lyase [Neorhizobium sp. R1-B]|jgi:N-acetylneuraminate lyase|uniref:N-acetylneuraminate lyase n=1 Tax=Neorhizobium sp. R1-B TaxID=2485162 RepID=UPI000DD5D89F|nr:N-acetylneuraminate lyase [Neorhizobium sp. R1-B]TDX79555.1 N-acetylneuraminate lyase [Neorhizobium sp. R1-B]
MTNLEGIFSALLTPFKDDETIDRAAIGPFVDFQVRQKIQGTYVGGSSGEAMLQSLQERSNALEWTADAAAGRLALIAHVGAIATADTIELARVANTNGYNAVSAITPYYYGFSREEVMEHYRALADASALPLIIYNFPARTAGFSTEELSNLLGHGNIIGIKHTSSDMFQLERLRQTNPDALIYNGYDEMCLAGLASGARGAIGTTYNFMGDLFVALQAHVLAGQIEDARTLQRVANDIIDVLIAVGVMPGSKAALDVMGVPIGPSRRPFRKLHDADRARLEESLQPLLSWRAANA